MYLKQTAVFNNYLSMTNICDKHSASLLYHNEIYRWVDEKDNCENWIIESDFCQVTPIYNPNSPTRRLENLRALHNLATLGNLSETGNCPDMSDSEIIEPCSSFLMRTEKKLISILFSHNVWCLHLATLDKELLNLTKIIYVKNNNVIKGTRSIA